MSSMSISGLLNIQSTTVFFPKDKAERMKHRDEQDGNAAENVGSLLQAHVSPGVTLTPRGLSEQAWSNAQNS